MPDEKPEEKKQDVQEEAPKTEKAPEKKPEKTEAKPAAKKEEPEAAAKPQAKKTKKISQMTLAEIETQLKKVKEQMGGFQSRFARHLLSRKRDLEASRSK